MRMFAYLLYSLQPAVTQSLIRRGTFRSPAGLWEERKHSTCALG